MRVIPVDKSNSQSPFLILVRSTREKDELRKTVKDMETSGSLG
jgi:hypothetical protein